MADENWQKAKEIFAEALRRKPAERRRFLDDVCADDAETRREVESLLASFDDAGSFMESPAVTEVADAVQRHKILEKGIKFGHYEIVRQIGAGGMGEVYLAKDNKLDRQVAVKILNEQFSRHEANLDRFVAEAKAASALNHPNIIVIYEIGDADGANYIVSEFIEGETLREKIVRTACVSGRVCCDGSPPAHAGGSDLPLAEVLEIVIQIANALTAAHTAHIVHRDIKPENIMIRPDGYVKILDFGLAKLVEQKAVGFDESTIKQNRTAKGVILGTVNYMSPEQAKGEKIDARTDVFSFGVVIYEMIAGRTPFAGDSMSETFANLINSEPPPLIRYSSNVPDELQRIVAKTLHKKKDERYQTMRDVLTDLKSLRENLAFDERLEKSNSSGDRNATAVLQATTGEANQRTAETNNPTGRFNRRKSFAALAFAALLIGAVGLGYYFWTLNKSASSKKSLAVLPFVNVGNDANAEYLSDGITESIINNLSQLSGLKVMSRNSVFRFKTNQIDTRQIALQLGVETLVTGDIKQLGDKLVINVRLIDGRDDSQIWGNQYVKNSTDIIAAQNEIAQAVAGNLRVKLTNSEQQQLRKNYTENAKALELYLRGRYAYFKVTEPELRKSIEFYRQAIDADPNYALAYAGIADAYRTLSVSGGSVAPQEAFSQAKAMGQKALELDANLAEAHIVLGWTGFLYDWNWSAAEADLKKALELSPNNADALRAYAHLLSNAGRHDEAVAMGRRARELDPLSLITNALEGQFLFYAGRDEEAIARLNKTLELDPNFWVAHNVLGRVYLRQKRFAEAIAEFNAARKSSGGSSEPLTQSGYALAKSGDRQAAQAALEELQSIGKENYVPAYNYAMIYNGLGETDEALNYLEKSSKQREAQMASIKIDTRWDNLRSEPRFSGLMKDMNFE